jgi:pantoate--beta-alanine ligase
MQIISTIRAFREVHKTLNGSLGLVPTMGFLHEGHLALVARAKSENTFTAVSIFVNPTQFGPNEDFTNYPRDMEHDLALLQTAGADLVFVPTVEEMYPTGFQTFVEVTGVSQGLEGERRPGHFRGVATVVCKLFNSVQPNRAYFGQKDAQQCAVIRQMVRDLALPLDIIIVPTQRAEDGLALSSRNSYLTAEQRQAAPVLYRALMVAKQMYESGTRSANALRQAMLDTIAGEPLATVDYVSVADAVSLQELEGPITRLILLSMAVRIGRARLIDNWILGE